MEKVATPVLWQNRHKLLKEIKRYSRIEVMFYRTDLLIHKNRVVNLLEQISPTLKELYGDYDPILAKVMADIHDDLEIITGDIPLSVKLSENQLDKTKRRFAEFKAIQTLLKCYPEKINGYLLEEILRKIYLKNCREAEAVSLVDKIDGYCEAVHEVLAGNLVFIEPVMNYLLFTFNNPKEKFSNIANIFDFYEEIQLLNFGVIDMSNFFNSIARKNGQAHSIKILDLDTGISQYDAWKKVTIATGEIDSLVKIKESYNY